MDNIKITMIAPQFMAGGGSEELGICSITAVLRKNGYDVKLISLLKGNENYAEIADFKPDVIGITVYDHTVEFVYDICRHLREDLPDAIICVGGYTPTYHAEEMLGEAPFIDYAFKGEGELIFLDFVGKLKARQAVTDVKGLVYRNGANEIVSNEKCSYIEDLDELPILARDLLTQENMTLALVTSTRGCMKNCYFCCGNDFWRKENKYSWRGRTIKKFVDEIEHLNRNMNINEFWVVDASFEDPGFNEERMTEFAEEVIGRGLRISYLIFCRANFYRRASEKLINLLVDSGLVQAYVGIEGANTSDLKLFGKGYTIEDNQKSIEFFKSHGVYTEMGFINFNPYSTLDGLRENADFLEKYEYARFFRYFSILSLFKGSKLYEICKQDGLLKEGKFYRKDRTDVLMGWSKYSYNFVDKRVETLAKYSFEYYEYLREKINLDSEFLIFLRYYGDKLSHLKRNFKVNDDYTALEQVDEHQHRLDTALSGLNGNITAWVKGLIDLAEKGWNDARAGEIGDDLLSGAFVYDTIKKLTMERIRFGKSLATIDRKYLSLLKK